MIVDQSPEKSCSEEAALEVPPSCVREPFFGVVAEDGPTLYGPWLLQQPPRTGSTWLKTEKIQNGLEHPPVQHGYPLSQNVP